MGEEKKLFRMDEIVPDFRPREEIFSRIPSHPGEPEMTPFESAFLCGMLKFAKPKKLLEVGVAAGGTTAIILQCMEGLGREYEMHSVDILADYWDGSGRPIGFLANVAKELLHPRKHRFYFGAGVAKHLEEIGKGIDFVMLDTAHFLPGEVLDFLAVLPFLKDGAVVCLHDTAIHQIYEHAQAHACGVLFQTVSGEKFLNFTPSGQYPNIAAFRVTQETRDRIVDVFCSLMLRWSYLPGGEELDRYTAWIHGLYNKDKACCRIYDEAVRRNRQNLAFRQNLQRMVEALPKGARIALYGAGTRGRTICAMLREMGHVRVMQWVDQEHARMSQVHGLVINSPDEICVNELDYVMVTPVRMDVVDAIREKLYRMGVPEERILSMEEYGTD